MLNTHYITLYTPFIMLNIHTLYDDIHTLNKIIHTQCMKLCRDVMCTVANARL